jgi:hypothetical protein
MFTLEESMKAHSIALCIRSLTSAVDESECATR